jgi:iron complex outermembrane receptor protein
MRLKLGQAKGVSMGSLRVWNQLALAAVMAGGSGEAFAQDRSDDNAITQAEDAFGFAVGREAIGIYGPGNARGFSPTAAGNVRIDGLYFDPAFGLQNILVDSTSIKVGISAQGYPFVAPSGIVDQRLRRPNDKAGGSVIGNLDSWGGGGIELDGSLPISSTLGVRAGFAAGSTEFPNGTDNYNHGESLLLRWRPTSNVEVIPFWSRFDDYDDEIGTFYVPAGSFLPPVDRPRHYDGPEWADIRFTGKNVGLLASWGIAKNTLLRFGAFRSTLNFKHNFNQLMIDVQPDGTGERITIADPPTENRSLSGELRLTHSIADGPRLHVVHLSVRKRDARREFGGSDFVSFGIGEVGDKITDPMPDFEFGELTRQRVRQTTFGIAYDGRWRDVGEISFSLSRANFDKRTRIPDTDEAIAKSRPWLYNATAAVILSNRVSLYAGYARGLEESGVAPASAANRNEPLDTIITTQKDAGIKVDLTKDMKAIVGVFDLSRPYFGFDADNVFRHVGSIRSRGAEFSVSGKVTPTLNLLVGGVILRPKVTRNVDTQGEIGRKPFGLPTHVVNFNANWQTPVEGLQLDAGLFHRGRQPADVENIVFLDPRFTMNLGGRYSFKLMQRTATFRAQVQNVFDNNDPFTQGPAIYGPGGSRLITGALTVDF